MRGVHYWRGWTRPGRCRLCTDDEQERRLAGDQDCGLSRWGTAVSDGIATQHALLGAPLEYLTPLERPTLAEARAWCHHLATSHYENFHVATFFLPRKVRPHFESIYAYCRVADDLGDEVADPVVATRLLDTWGSMLDELYDTPERSMHPFFVAIHETIRDRSRPL